MSLVRTMPSRSCRPFRSVLLAGTSIAILLAASTSSHAGQLGQALSTNRQIVSANTANIGTAVQQTAALQQTQRALARSGSLRQALVNQQSAARLSAMAGANSLIYKGALLSTVPNGLGTTEGLAPDAPETWINASEPTQTVVQTASGEKTTVTIKQSDTKALLNWKKFDIGKETTLEFDQKGHTDWVALNRINDPSGSPSQILGSIKASGQVYVVNQNGIVFGGSSQINLHSLVASSLWINHSMFANGLLSQTGEFQFSALPTITASTEPLDTPPTVSTLGDIIVQPGAIIEATTSGAHEGGRVILVGPNVENGGHISTPDGQAILAAGLQVHIREHDAKDASLRGLDVFVGKTTSAAFSSLNVGTVVNSGIIDVARANVTLVGANVAQNGLVSSTTSVALNGRIDIKAEFGTTLKLMVNEDGYQAFPSGSGLVTFGPGSVTEVRPETDSTETVKMASLKLKSSINVTGQSAHLDDESSIIATSGAVDIKTGRYDSIGLSASFIPGGQIYLDPGAVIDVSGLQGVTASAADTIAKVELRAAQLADSPLQRNGALRGKTVYVDLLQSGTQDGKAWIGTPLAEVSGYADLIAHTVSQLSVAGGSVNLSSGEGIILRSGSTINVSGGWTDYQGSLINTPTQLISGNAIIPIAKATADRVYDGILGTVDDAHSRWNVTKSYRSLGVSPVSFRPSFTQGANGGTLNLSSSIVVTDGSLYGGTATPGANQQTPAKLPKPSVLTLNNISETRGSDGLPVPSVFMPRITLGRTREEERIISEFAFDGAQAQPLSASQVFDIFISADVVGGIGFGSVSISSPSGSVDVPEGVVLRVAGPSPSLDASGGSSPGSRLSIDAFAIDFGGNYIAPGAEVSLKGTSTYLPEEIAAFQALGNFPSGTPRVLVSGMIDVSGHLAKPGDALLPTAGGHVEVVGSSRERQGNVSFSPGSVINVSVGASLDGSGKATYGKAGSISVKTALDGLIVLGGTFLGYSGETGGSLSLTADSLQIGGTTADPKTVLLSPEFFSQSGFATFSLTGLRTTGFAIDVTDGTDLSPKASSFRVEYENGSPVLRTYIKDDGLRTPISLSMEVLGNYFDGSNYTPASLRLGVGTTLFAEAGTKDGKIKGGSVSAKGDYALVFGEVTAPGGAISITSGYKYESGATVFLGKNASLSTAGVVVTTPNTQNIRSGAVLSGGSISLSGNVVALPGSKIDVSGTTGILDILGSDGRFHATSIDSNGGSITLQGKDRLNVESLLLGKAGGNNANGGSLSVSSGNQVLSSENASSYLPNLIVTQNTQGYLASFSVSDGILPTVTDLPPVSCSYLSQFCPSYAYFSVDQFNAGQFSSLTLGGAVQFKGNVSITAQQKLAVASSGVLIADGIVSLSAPIVALGQGFGALRNPPVTVPRTTNIRAQQFGTGRLTVDASTLIDVGLLLVEGVGSTRLQAINGDIRGYGVLDVAGELTLVAGQIYAPTSRDFKIVVNDGSAGAGSGKLIFEKGTVQRPLPLSAGGALQMFAATIEQGGVLRAPLGQISFGYDPSLAVANRPKDPFRNTATLPAVQKVTFLAGSETSVSGVSSTGESLLVPYGTVDLSGGWLDADTVNTSLSNLPTKRIQLWGSDIDIQANASIDLRGGGDLYGYRWVPGNGGTTDILARTDVYAILPGYDFKYQPLAGANVSGVSLAPGQSIHLNEGIEGLSAGTYTLLPARYALLPGAFLVSATSKSALATGSLADGTNLVLGTMINSLNPVHPTASTPSVFSILSAKAVRDRSEYTDFYGSTKFKADAQSQGQSVPRLPTDGGQLQISATTKLFLAGQVKSAGSRGRGSAVDITTSGLDGIAIVGTATTTPYAGLVLDAAQLSGFGAESLLIGGLRDATGTVTVNATTVILDNAGSPLSGPDVILVAKDDLTLTENAELIQTASLEKGAEALVIGTASKAGSGNSAAVRISADSSATLTRLATNASTTPVLTIRNSAKLSGSRANGRAGTIIADSSGDTQIDPNASLQAETLQMAGKTITLALDDAGMIPVNPGILLAGTRLSDVMAQTGKLVLTAYGSIDIYGHGTRGTMGRNDLTLRTGEIRGFNSSGDVTLLAKAITLDNLPGATSPGPIAPATGMLSLSAETLSIGAGNMAIDQFNAVLLSATRGMSMAGTGGVSVQGNLTVETPSLVGAGGAKQTLATTGTLLFKEKTATGVSPFVNGLGNELTLLGANVSLTGGNIHLASGHVTLRATSGDITLTGGDIDVGGIKQTFYDVTRYSNGGDITLISDSGSVLQTGGRLSVAATDIGGDAGTLTVSAISGGATLSGTLEGSPGADGKGGSAVIDVGTLADTQDIDASLNAGKFLTTRDIRVRTGDVVMNGTATARSYSLSADGGALTVSGTINANGPTGGSIFLAASKDVTLTGTARLNANGTAFDAAGKGGTVRLETRGNGPRGIEVQSGAAIDLSVAGGLGGTASLRAPRNGANTDVLIAAIQGTFLNARSFVVEGYKTYTPAGGDIGTVTTAAKNDATTFLGTAGSDTNTNAIKDRLFGTGASDLKSLARIAPGVEIVNPTGDLVLGTATSATTADLDLSTWRFGPDSTAGVLTLRAKNDITFYNALSDGFTGTGFTYPTGGAAQWGMMPYRLMAPGSTSWSYRIVAGADMTSADYRKLQALSSLSPNKGTVTVGKAFTTTSAASPPTDRTPYFSAINYYQVIRTGTGDIDVYAGRDVQMVNPFAAIYTAGQKINPDPLKFDVPDIDIPTTSEVATLPSQRSKSTQIPPQWSENGGNVTIFAGNDIARKGKKGTSLIDVSSQEMPTNWLYRRGYVDPLTGEFAKTLCIGASGTCAAATQPQDIAATAWWVDFSNFFEGVGALGGGNVVLQAGHDVKNTDAVAPTNAWMEKGTAATAAFHEYGGGDVTVIAGHDIDGGVYYVERGTGQLKAGGSIHSNVSRSTIDGNALTYERTGAAKSASAADPLTWLPTTLFVGKGTFSVSAMDDVLLGPVANPFALPQGTANSFLLRTYFNTYAPTSGVSVSSVYGDITFKNNGDDPGSLAAWYNNVLGGNLGTSSGNPERAGFMRPWLYLAEPSLQSSSYSIGERFSEVASVMPASLSAEALSGDIEIIGNLKLAPSSVGGAELYAKGSINGLNVVATTSLSSNFGYGTLSVSDADPALVSGIRSPYPTCGAFRPAALCRATPNAIKVSTDGRTNQTLSEKIAAHAKEILHANDPNPVRVYALLGDISGLSLHTPKPTRVLAGQDIADVGLYMQNLDSDDISLVSAGRDIVAYNQHAPRRAIFEAEYADSLPSLENLNRLSAQSGDIQLAGQGSLQVLAGRNIDLGVSSLSSPNDGTFTGVTTIGNASNPYLPEKSASITLVSGMGEVAQTLGGDKVSFGAFASQFLDPAKGEEANRLLEELGTALGLASSSADDVWDAYQRQGNENKKLWVTEAFFLVLRDAGRDHNNPEAKNKNYEQGYAAIKALFPTTAADGLWPSKGSIALTSRVIKTKQGGNVNILAPNGEILVGYSLGDAQPLDQGILTEGGGDIHIFAHGSTTIGTSRIFTLRGGNEIIWSTVGDIAAGAASKTVKAAPPTRVKIDPDTTNMTIDLSGLATGGGIGVLASLPGVAEGNVDLIAPVGTVDAGDAGIRSTGNINVAAQHVRNSDNFSAGGKTVGTPVSVAPNVGAQMAASGASGGNTTSDAAKQSQKNNKAVNELPSIITVRVLGYGGSSGSQQRQTEGSRPHAEMQNPNGRYQVIGTGEISTQQIAMLVEAKRREIGR